MQLRLGGTVERASALEDGSQSCGARIPESGQHVLAGIVATRPEWPDVLRRTYVASRGI